MECGAKIIVDIKRNYENYYGSESKEYDNLSFIVYLCSALSNSGFSGVQRVYV